MSGHAGRSHSAILAQYQPDFLLYRVRSRRSSKHWTNEDGAGHDSYRPRPDPLARRLFWLVERAGLNMFSGAVVPLAEQYAAIRRTAEEVEIVPGIALSEVLWMHPKWLTEGWAAARLKKLAEGLWPNAVPLQGYLLSLFDEVAGNTLAAGPIRIPVEGRLRVFAGEGITASKPYIALATVRHEHDADRCVLGRAYAHPCLQDAMAPVNSDLEHKTAQTLAWIAKTAANDYGVEVVIEKPLFGHYSDGTELVRPDFEIHVQDHVLVIETMDRDDPEYRASKARAHAIMRQIGPVFEDERGYVIDDKEAGRKLAKFVFGWMRAIGALRDRTTPAPTT